MYTIYGNLLLLNQYEVQRVGPALIFAPFNKKYEAL